MLSELADDYQAKLKGEIETAKASVLSSRDWADFKARVARVRALEDAKDLFANVIADFIEA